MMTLKRLYKLYKYFINFLRKYYTFTTQKIELRVKI